MKPFLTRSIPDLELDHLAVLCLVSRLKIVSANRRHCVAAKLLINVLVHQRGLAH